MKMLTAILLSAMLVLSPACASSLKLKQAATTTLQSSSAGLHDLRVAELAFYQGHTVPAYNAAAHLKFLDLMDQSIMAEQEAARGLLAWNPSDTATKPASVADYARLAQAMLNIAAATGIPKTHDFLASAQRTLDQANATLAAINGGKNP